MTRNGAEPARPESSPDPAGRELAGATVAGTLWSSLGQYGTKILNFVATVVLARVLLPEDFGLVGYALVLMGFLEVFTGAGIRNAVVYLDDRPHRRDAAFMIAAGSGIGLYAFAWGAAPLAADFFGDARVTEVTRLLTLHIPLASLALVHEALLIKKLAFGKLAVPEITRGVTKGVGSVVLALAGWGVWSLVVGHLIGALTRMLVLWWMMPWRPSFALRRHQWRRLLGYGSGSVAIDLLGLLLLNIDYLVVGRFLGTEALGVYLLAFRIPELTVQQLCYAIGNVTFSVYVRLQEDVRELRSGYLAASRALWFLALPAATGIALVSEPVILVLFTDKWIDAVPVMTAIAVYTLLRALVYLPGAVYKAIDRQWLLTRLSLAQVIVAVPALWWAAAGPSSLIAVAWTQVAVAAFGVVLNLVVVGRVLEVRARRFAAELAAPVACTLWMATLVYLVGQALADQLPIVRLVAMIATGIASYLGALATVARKDLAQARDLLRGLVGAGPRGTGEEAA